MDRLTALVLGALVVGSILGGVGSPFEDVQVVHALVALLGVAMLYYFFRGDRVTSFEVALVMIFVLLGNLLPFIVGLVLFLVLVLLWYVG